MAVNLFGISDIFNMVSELVAVLRVCRAEKSFFKYFFSKNVKEGQTEKTKNL